MIRFIDLSDQICEGTNEFAFWDTTVDRFCNFNGSQTWETVEQFIMDFEEEKLPVRHSIELKRYLSLIPNDWGVSKLKETNRKLTHHPECCCQYNPSSAIAEQTVLASECCPIHNYYPSECFANPKCKHCK